MIRGLNLRDKTDKVLASEGAPCFLLEVVISKDTGGGEVAPFPSFPLKGQGVFREVVLRAWVFRYQCERESTDSLSD